MKRRHQKNAPSKRLRRIMIFLGVPLVSLCATFIFLYVFTPVRYQPPEPALATPTTVVQKPATTPATTPTATIPVRLAIKSIAVDAKVNPTGLTVNGDMAIDSNPKELAWYQLGPKPGEAGNAVIAGHYGWKDGVASVFNDLNSVKPGDVISTFDAAGLAVNFAVTSIRLYNPDDDATQVFVSTDTKAHLNIITCQGSWNNAQRTYSERLVVFTDKIKA